MGKNKALIIVDMINDFVYGSLSFKDAKTVINPISKLISSAHENNIPIIYACDLHLPSIDFEFTKWDSHALINDNGSKIIDDFVFDEKDYIIHKRRYSAFFHTDLDLLLKELKVEEVVVVGLQAHICVIHTLGGAFMNGLKTILVSDATSSENKKDYLNTIEYAKNIYGTKILNADEVIKLFMHQKKQATGIEPA